jgi:hypothetical protein
MPLAEKAKSATVLVESLRHTSSQKEQQRLLRQLNELWPDVRFRWLQHGELVVGILERERGSWREIPHGLVFAASRIEVVRLDGSAEVIKNRDGLTGPIPEASIPLSAFEPKKSPKKRSLTCWERLLED